MASERATRSASKWLTKRGGEFSDIDPLADLIDRERAEAVREQREMTGCYKAIAEARKTLLTCYRVGTQRGADAALTKIEKAEARLGRLMRKAAIRARSEGEADDGE